MKFKWINLLLILFLLGTVSAECEKKVTFSGRIQDTCIDPNDGVCNDAEFPMDSDCEITIQSLGCNEGRCVFTEMWFGKLLLIVIAFLIVFYKKDHHFFLIISVLLLVINFGYIGALLGNGVDVKAQNPKQEVIIPQEQIDNNIFMKYGQKVMPSNPEMGMIILGIALFALIKNMRRDQ